MISFELQAATIQLAQGFGWRVVKFQAEAAGLDLVLNRGTRIIAVVSARRRPSSASGWTTHGRRRVGGRVDARGLARWHRRAPPQAKGAVTTMRDCAPGGPRTRSRFASRLCPARREKNLSKRVTRGLVAA